MHSIGRRYRLPIIFALILMGSGLAASRLPRPAEATSITVNTELDIAPNAQGQFPQDNKCSLRAAIQSAQFNTNTDPDCSTGLGNGVLDIIQIDASLTGKTLKLSYDPDGATAAYGVQPFDLISGTVDPDTHVFSNPMEIRGPTTKAADFVIDGDGKARILEIGFGGFGNDSNHGEVKLANLTIRGGNATHTAPGGSSCAVNGDGGAICLGDGSHLTLDNVVLRNNSAARGGAIVGNAPIITNNGGAYINNSASSRGGAVYLNEGPLGSLPTLNGYAVLFDGNTAGTTGGAISTNPGSGSGFVHLERSLAMNNHAASGGVMFIDSTLSNARQTVFELMDSTITGNTATNGGVFFGVSSQFEYRYLRDTFVNNTGIGGLFNAGGGFIANSIIVDSGCHNTTDIGRHSGVSNLFGGTNTGCRTDLLGSLGTVTNLATTLEQNGGPEVQKTFALLTGSNAIDAGNATYCGTIDARSVPRGVDGDGTLNSPTAGDCDIGAYEFADYVVNFKTGSSSVLEGGSKSIEVVLTIPDPAKRPLLSPVTINVTRNQASTARNEIDYQTPGPSVTFPIGAGGSGTASQFYNVTTLQDNVAERFGEKILFDLAPNTAGVAIAEPREHDLSIQDDDQAGIKRDDGGNGTTVSEVTPNVADSLTISLRSQPDYSQPDPNDSNSYGPPADVQVKLEPDRDCTATVDGVVGTASLGTPLTFKILNADWQVPHTVRVKAVDDPYDEDFRDETAPHQCGLAFTFNSDDPVYDATNDLYNVSVIDNDTAGVTIVESGAATDLVEGGATDTYTIRLDSVPDPGKPLPSTPRGPTKVVVNPDSQCDAGNGAGVPVAVPFTAADWFIPQTVTVKAVDDPTVELDHSCTFTHTIDSEDAVYANLDDAPPFLHTPRSIVAGIKDYEPPTITNDPPFVDIETGDGIAVDEATAGSYDTFTVVLERQPLNENVVVNMATTADPRIPGDQIRLQDDDPNTILAALGTLQLKFTPANWNVPQTVRVFAVNDDYDEDKPHTYEVRFAMSSSAVGFNDSTLRKFVIDGVESPNAGALDVTIADNDVSAVVVTESGGSTDLTEGGASDGYTVKLATHPYGDVTVTATPDSQCDIGNGAGQQKAIDIAAAAWNTPVTIDVTAVDDALIESTHNCVITHTVTSTDDSKYDGLAAPSVVATITDNDFPRVLITTSGPLNLDERLPGFTGSYTVKLQSKPDANVTVNLSVTDGQTLIDNGGTPGTSLALVFTPANFDTTQTVHVTVIDDAIDEADPHTGIVKHSISTTATGYSTDGEIWINGSKSATGNLVASIADDDTAAVDVTPPGLLKTFEVGTSLLVPVVLGSEPTGPVTIDASSSDTTEATVSPAQLTFDASNWNQQQTLLIAGVNDDLHDGNQPYTITLAISSADTNYGVLTNIVLQGTNVDDDHAGVVVTETAGSSNTTEAGGSDTFTVVLTSEPLSTVTVTVGSSDTGEGTVAPSPLTFTPATWSTPQTVTVTGVDDFNDDGDQIFKVTFTLASDDPDYNLTSVPSVAVMNADDDFTGVKVTPASGLTTTEAGGTATVDVSLGSQPAGEVTVTLDSSDPGEGSVSPPTMTFDAGNWSTPQQATLTGADDAIDDGDQPWDLTATTSSAADSTYDSLTASASATNTDDDTAGVTLSPTPGLNTTEAGGTDTFSVVLDSEPTADVTIALASTDTGEGTVSADLTFTAANWNIPQTVTATGVDDQIDDGDVAYTVTTAVSSADLTYDSIAAPDVPATNADDDTAGVTVTPTSGLNTTEAAGTDTFTVVLLSEPTADVTVALESTDTGEGTVSADLTFTAANWNTSQTVTVTGVDDADDDGDVAYSVTTTISSADAVYDGIAAADVSVTNADDDITVLAPPTIAFAKATASGSEAHTPAKLKVVLSRALTESASVKFAVTGGGATSGKDYALAAGTLVFAPGQTAKDISAVIVDDNNVESHETFEVTLSSVTGATLGAVRTMVYVIEDNDFAQCVGSIATIAGSAGPDILMGTPGDDIIVGLGGGDTIYGLGGNDIICGRNGPDTIFGGSGDDLIFTGDGDDVVDAGSGNDTVYTRRGNDKATGGTGADTIYGGPGGDQISGAEGNDTLVGAQGNDDISGNGGEDRLRGGPGNDKLDGGPGADRLNGGTGNDACEGGSGTDVASPAASCETTTGIP